MLRTALPAALAAALATAVAGAQQRPGPEELLQRKLASPFLRHADWTVDYDAARRMAKAEGKLIFGYFTTAGP